MITTLLFLGIGLSSFMEKDIQVLKWKEDTLLSCGITVTTNESSGADHYAMVVWAERVYCGNY